LSNRSIRAIVLSALFLISGLGASLLISPASATPNGVASPAAPSAGAPSALTQAEADWAAGNGNAFNQDYNPQNQINATTVQYLGLSWLFPVPPRASDPALAGFVGFVRASEGVDSAPLIVNGTVYVITTWGDITALNAANGDVLWHIILPILPNSTADIQGVAGVATHLHDGSEQYTTKLFGGTPTLWYAAPDLKVYAIDAITGAYELNFTYFTGTNSVQGNSPDAIELPIAPNVLVDQDRGIAITSIGSPNSAITGRCLYRGWNVLDNPPQLMWTSYCTPPQPGGNLPLDLGWDVSQVNNMTGAEIFYPGPSADSGGYIANNNGQAVVNLKTLTAAQLNSSLYNDWGYSGQSTACSVWDAGASTGSTSSGWGSPWLLGSGSTNGMAFVNTNNRDPFGGPCAPGPDLWAASVLALNETNGAWIWGFQATPHDEMDYDCSWWQALGNETISGVNTPVIWKTCKNGYLYELNALTGNLIWAWTSPQTQVPRCPNCYILDPLNATQMNQAYFAPKAEGSGQGTITNPGTGAGFESEGAYDPQLNYLFVAEQNSPSLEYYVPVNGTAYGTYSGLSSKSVPYLNPDNITLSAIDAGTGQAVWSYFVPTLGYRGAISTTGGLVFLPLASGDIDILNAQTGKLVRDIYIGGPLNQLATFGATVNGSEELVMSINSGGTSQNVPGDIFAMSLSIPSAVGASTTTVTSVSTSISVSTSTTTLGGGGAVVTSTVTGSGQVTTITTTTTSSATVYGLAAVAVIFIVATGYFAMRGRKPAP
jgi:hypothetical protein